MKKIFKTKLFAVVFAAMIMASCQSNNDKDEVVLTLNATEIDYDESGLWKDALNPDANIVSQGYTFSHSANVEWASWNGFVASRDDDNAEYADSWLVHQCCAMPSGGLSGTGTPYLVAYWNSSETEDTDLAERSCKITFSNGNSFTPQSVFVTNNSYVYYTVINGSAYSRKFAKGDYFALKIYGHTGSAVVGPVTVYLADYRSEKETEWSVLKDWTFVNLESLGEVKALYFVMESTDTGAWGINTPTYFAMDRIKVKI